MKPSESVFCPESVTFESAFRNTKIFNEKTSAGGRRMVFCQYLSGFYTSTPIPNDEWRCENCTLSIDKGTKHCSCATPGIPRRDLNTLPCYYGINCKEIATTCKYHHPLKAPSPTLDSSTHTLLSKPLSKLHESLRSTYETYEAPLTPTLPSIGAKPQQGR